MNLQELKEGIADLRLPDCGGCKYERDYRLGRCKVFCTILVEQILCYLAEQGACFQIAKVTSLPGCYANELVIETVTLKSLLEGK